MLFDISELDSGAELRAPVCIIGAGAAGISLARYLAQRDVGVLLLESGGLEVEGDVQALNDGEASAATYPPIDGTRLRYFGGTTNHWAGQSTPLDPIDFEARSWVPDSGWPIAYEDYTRYLGPARELCEIGPESFDYSRAAQRAGLSAFPDLPGFEPVLLRWSPPTRFGERYRPDLESDEHVRCCLHATCLRLVADADGERIEAAEVASLEGHRIRVVAERFVVAAGAIENARLLLSSPRPGSGVALGNEHDLVGRYFMEHPNIRLHHTALSRDPANDYLTRAEPDTDSARIRRDGRLSRAVQEEERILNHSFYFLRMQDPPPNPTLGEKLVRLWDRVNAKIFDDTGPPRDYELVVRPEHAPNRDSRVTLLDSVDALGLPKVKIDFRFGELEPRTILRVQERLARAIGGAGLGRMKLDLEAEEADQWVERAGWQYHHMGGTRMHPSPRHGVVDTDCLVHGTKNLYIAGSSVFPTCGHANPTMNLIAMTLRLGDHLTRASS